MPQPPGVAAQGAAPAGSAQSTPPHAVPQQPTHPQAHTAHGPVQQQQHARTPHHGMQHSTHHGAVAAPQGLPPHMHGQFATLQQDPRL